MTNPSRSTLYGREAVSGESFRLERACIAANAASVRPWITASEPPAMITSAWPARSASTAFTIDSVLDAQAEATVRA